MRRRRSTPLLRWYPSCFEDRHVHLEGDVPETQRRSALQGHRERQAAPVDANATGGRGACTVSVTRHAEAVPSDVRRAYPSPPPRRRGLPPTNRSPCARLWTSARI